MTPGRRSRGERLAPGVSDQPLSNGVKSALFAVLLAGILYLPGVTPALSGDDYVHTYKNRHPPADWHRYFLELDGREYRPIIRLSLALDHHLWAGRARGYHVTNLLLHLANTAFVFLLTWILSNNLVLAFASSALFAVHPIHSYSVNAVMGRTDVLMTSFYLGAVLAAVKQKMLLATVLFAFALLTKEAAITLPLLLLMLFLFWRHSLRGRFPLLSILFSITFIYLLLRLTLLRPEVEDLTVYLSTSATEIAKNLFFYAGGLAIPVAGYQLRYWFETASIVIPATLAIAVLASTGIWIWWKRSQLEAPFWAGIAWIVLTLLPMLLLFQRRYLYLPSIGFCLSLGFLLTCRSDSTAALRFRKIALATLIAILGIATYHSSRQWKAAGIRAQEVVRSIVGQAPDLEHTELFVLNVPNGLGEAHLFTHESLRFALARELAVMPNVQVVSRIHSSFDSAPPQVLREEQRVITRIQPGPQDYFVFDVPELLPRGGRFLPAGTRFQKGPFTMEVTGNSPDGAVSELTVGWASLSENQRVLCLEQRE